MISLLISLLIIVLIAWLIFWVVGQMGLPQPARTVVCVVCGLVLILVLLSYLPHHAISIPW